MKLAQIRVDYLDAAYPSFGSLVSNYITPPPQSTLYGYVHRGDVKMRDGREIRQGEYFCLPYEDQVDWGLQTKTHQSRVFVACRLGFLGQRQIGSRLEKQGRLSYIDGCSSTMLVYPPRLGDPSFHHLHFPPSVNQSWHTHPAARIGLIVRGSGKASVRGAEHALKPGMMFGLDPMEPHRFRTEHQSMDLVVFHPEGDWGPQDENHPMLNRTLILK